MEESVDFPSVQSRTRREPNSPLPRLPGINSSPSFQMGQESNSQSSSGEEERVTRSGHHLLPKGYLRMHDAVMRRYRSIITQLPCVHEELSQIIRDCIELGRIEEILSCQYDSEDTEEASSSEDERDDPTRMQ